MFGDRAGRVPSSMKEPLSSRRGSGGRVGAAGRAAAFTTIKVGWTSHLSGCEFHDVVRPRRLNQMGGRLKEAMTGRERALTKVRKGARIPYLAHALGRHLGYRAWGYRRGRRDRGALARCRGGLWRRPRVHDIRAGSAMPSPRETS
jgi:hypothetical protein